MVWLNEDGEIHRENDLPALIYVNGEKHWYKYGQCHRENDMPAVILLMAENNGIKMENL